MNLIIIDLKRQLFLHSWQVRRQFNFIEANLWLTPSTLHMESRNPYGSKTGSSGEISLKTMVGYTKISTSAPRRSEQGDSKGVQVLGLARRLPTFSTLI